ncbi:hypothetical protein CK203_093225 [Vitis vinifera]|uniref:Uncharacterized protein n=1 Tax=Vitis vinifera TaxID=29760 RepID=A0A438CMJ6_VITVI|nr:hypothetical protein CK203_093225 [Vitis vinifera]
MVSQRGIEVSPDQVKAVMETPPPRNKKELQRLTGKLVASRTPIPKEKLYMYLAGIRMGNQCRSIPLPLTQGAEAYLLCQQGIGRRRNQIFKNGANNLSPSKHCPKTPALFSSPPGDRVD